MSILIKGMKTPEDCFSCPLKEEGFCNITNAYAMRINERNSDCPLIELPDHHGKLIDADALEPDADYDDGEFWAYSITQVRNAQTIVNGE